MRGSALLAIGAALMVIALCFAAAVAVYAMRQAESTQALTSEPAPPVETTPSEPIVEPRRTEASEPPKYERFDIPEPEPRRQAPVQLPPREAPVQIAPERPVTSPPAADVVTLVAVRTCNGDMFRLNVAERQMFDLHNQTRERHGLQPLCLSPDLTQVARAHSQDMLDRDYFSHYTPEGTMVRDEMERLGYPVATAYMVGENIAMGGDTEGYGAPDHLFVELMNSPGHRANILDSRFREVGIGARRGIFQDYREDPMTAYTIDFGARV